MMGRNNKEKILIIGSTGMLGQALLCEAKKLQLDIATVARANAQLSLDIADLGALSALDLGFYGVVVNAAAMTDIHDCENRPLAAHCVNSVPVEVLANKAREAGAYFIQISTDHYFTGDIRTKHNENASVKLLNEYARTKYLGEIMALKNPEALVVRTNIVGWRGWQGRQTFVEWVVAQLESGSKFTAFEDFYTSSIDVTHFSKALFSLISLPWVSRPRGLLNLASSQVFSKKEFIEAFALRNRYDLKAMVLGSVKNLAGPPRAESLGLDVRRAEALLGYSLPDLTQVVDILWEEFRKKSHAL